jgi:hypothetical protein
MKIFNFNRDARHVMSFAILLVTCITPPTHAQDIALPATPVTMTKAEVSPSQLPRGTANAPAYPKQWKKFLDNWNEVNRVFKTHIAGARNISIPTNPREFKWKINWAAQQAYCKSIAQAIFEEPQRFEFALPDVIAARDGVEAAYDAIGNSYPKCTAPGNPVYGPESFRPATPSRKNILVEQSQWTPEQWRDPEFAKKRGGSLSLGYLVGDDYLLRFSFYDYFDMSKGHSDWWKNMIRQPKAPRTHWSREPTISRNPANGCPATDGGSAGTNVEPTAGQGFGDWMPGVILSIDGYPVPLEFGVYGYNGTEPPPPSFPTTDRWGKRGQKFLFVRSLQHDFWGDWSLVSLTAVMEPPMFGVMEPVTGG